MGLRSVIRWPLACAAAAATAALCVSAVVRSAPVAQGSKEPATDTPAKLAPATKIKDCCGYPIADPGAYRLTFYWDASQEAHELETPTVDVYDVHGLYLGTYPQSFADDLKMEGTGILLDGRVLNWAGSCNKGAGTCYVVLDPSVYPEGRGAGDRTLKVYRSIAVDPRMIHLGDAVYLPELDGVVLPDGTVHDGCVVADDVGAMIKRKHVDFFVGGSEGYRLIDQEIAGKETVTPEVAAPQCQYLVDSAPHTFY
jgi:3D (Asp-Asp-Asp) domain-containing protein